MVCPVAAPAVSPARAGSGASWPPVMQDHTHGDPRPGRKRKRLVIAGAAALALVSAIGLTGYLGTRPLSSVSTRRCPGNPCCRSTASTSGLSPGGVALDKAGDVLMTSEGMYGRVVELPAGSSTPTVLPFSGLYQPQGLAGGQRRRGVRRRFQQQGDQVGGRVEQPDRAAVRAASTTPKVWRWTAKATCMSPTAATAGC